MLLLLQLLACNPPPPDVTAVAPVEALPGDTVRITGANFDEEVEATLHVDGGTLVLPLDVRSATEATAEIPADVPSGVHVVAVHRPGKAPGATATLEVWRPETEPPCDKRYALSVETSRTQRRVIVERIFRDRPATREVLTADALAAVEHTRTPTPAGGTCSAVWVRTTDGVRWLLADDPEKDLAPVAEELAGVLGLPLER